MAPRKIFIISPMETSTVQSSNRNGDEIAEASPVPDIKYRNGLHVLTILCCSALATSIFALIPRHNSIIEPSYWFEINFQLNLG